MTINGEEKEQEITWYDDGEVLTGTMGFEVEEGEPLHVEMITEVEEADLLEDVVITSVDSIEEEVK